jgi:hypothetical protein
MWQIARTGFSAANARSLGNQMFTSNWLSIRREPEQKGRKKHGAR